MKQLPLPFAFLFSVLLFSQSKVDSLQGEYEKASTKEQKVTILHELFLLYIDKDPDRAQKTILEATELSTQINENRLQVLSYNYYADYLRSKSIEDSASMMNHKALELSKKIGFREGQSDALVGLGNANWRKGNFEKAEEYLLQNIELVEGLEDKSKLANSYMLLGGIRTQNLAYTDAMDFYIRASRLYNESGNLKKYSQALGNIGFVQRNLSDFQSAKSYLEQSDKIAKQLDFKSQIAFNAYNMSIVFRKTGELDSAIVFNQRAIRKYEELGNRKRVAFGQFTMGKIYWEKQDFNKALDYYSKSLELSQQVGDSVNIGHSYEEVAKCYHKLQNNIKAKENLIKAMQIANHLKLNVLAMNVHEILSEIEEQERNYPGALRNTKRFMALKDSLYTREKRELAKEIEAKYQNEQKTREIALLESERTLKELQLGKRVNERNGIIAFSVVLLLLAGLLYQQYRVKRRTNKELLELDRLKSNFFANISHEFRTPLTLIKGPIEQLEQNPDEGLPIGSIKMIRRNTNRVLQLVNQLLDLSRIDEGNLQLEKTEGDVYKCLRGAASSFNSHAAQRNIDYKVQIPHEVLWTTFDRDRLEKILYNLLGNAFKYIDDGGLISFSSTYKKGELRMVISDTGIGIPKEKLPYIFDRFYQVHNGDTREHEGSGIGLSLSKELVELMDGTITVSSELGKGAIFTTVIPVQKIRMGVQETVQTQHSDGKEINTPRPSYTLERPDLRELPCVLLVEDNPDMSFFIKEQLQKNYRVLEAKNGKIGLKLAKSKNPDLVITDVMMPEMDGVELCKSLKADLDTSHIPVIMLTAKAGMENKMIGLQTGADDYLTKPFEPKELLARAVNLIAQRKKLRLLFSKKDASINPKEVTATSIDEKFLQKVLDLLEKEFSNPEFGTPQMQRALALSKAQLHRKLKALTNESPGELLRNFRLKRAAQLLSNNADTVTQIAYAVGFNNLSYFAKCFKELYGVPPSSY